MTNKRRLGRATPCYKTPEKRCRRVQCVLFYLRFQEYQLLHPVISKRDKERKERQKEIARRLENFDEVAVSLSLGKLSRCYLS